MSETRRQVGLCFLLFFCVFGIWQAMHFVVHIYPLPFFPGSVHPAYLITQIASIGVFALFVKLSGTSFKDRGFRGFETYERQVAVSVFLVIVYFTITIFIPVFFIETDPQETIALEYIPIQFLSVLLTSIASEAIFRGYIFTDLAKAYMFLPALYLSSLLFSLHSFPVPLLSSLDILHFVFTGVVPLFISGLFLGLFFQKTRSLLGPVTFQTVLLLIHSINPLRLVTDTSVTLTFEVIAYIFITVLMSVLIEEKRKEPIS